MSDDTAREEAPRTPGSILAAERERQGLARADIAQRLHMSVSQVEALEASDYARLPRGPFLRGFARNYARSLGLDADAMVGLLAEDAPPEPAPDIIVPSQNIRFDPLGQRLASPYVKAAAIALVLLMLGFAAMYWWLFVRPHAVVTVVRKPAIEASKDLPVAPPMEAKKAEPEAATATDAEAASRTPDLAPAVPPVTASERAEPPKAPAPGEGVLRLAFRGAAWVEIMDANGKVLVSRTHPGGSSAEISGKPPFTLVIGNAPEVRLTYNGADVDLAPHTRVAVARFSLP